MHTPYARRLSPMTLLSVSKTMSLRFVIALLAFYGTLSIASPVVAELPQDVREVFEDMLDNLDADLRAPFQAALAKDTAVVEMTPAQFRRFRDNPFNPFEGLDEIDASDGAGNIGLKFELPSLRTRPKAKFEKQNRRLCKPLKAVAQSASPSIVRLFQGKRQLAMGAIVSADGKVLTKHSEIENHDSVKCRLSDGKLVTATLIRADQKNDLALLQIDAEDLMPVQWSTSTPQLGQFLVTADEQANVLALGNYSVLPRSTNSGEQAFLGVKPETAATGVRISDVRPGTASRSAGLKNGDVITSLDGHPIREVSDLVFQIRQHRPGEQVEIEYSRGSQNRSTVATLAGNLIHGERAARFKMMNRLGAVPSRRNSNFPVVFQHDTPLFPEQCGGPVLNLDGQVVGLNIARNGRAATYAIPADEVQDILADLQREDVASRN